MDPIYALLTATQSFVAGAIVARYVHIASRDSETLLLNRRGLSRRRIPAKSTAMMVDLNGFKPVNDRFGHVAGDHVIRVVATRLDTHPELRHVTRLGGDEFAAIIPADSAEIVAVDVAKLVTTPIHYGDHVLTISAAIGLSAQHATRRNLWNALAEADAAMYRAKIARTGPARFDPATDRPLFGKRTIRPGGPR